MARLERQAPRLQLDGAGWGVGAGSLILKVD